MGGLNWQDIAAIVGLVTVGNVAFVWAVKWLLANNWQKLSKEIDAIHRTSEDLNNDLYSLKESLPKEYVRREDWIMGFSRIEQKIDGIWEYIHQQARKT